MEVLSGTHQSEEEQSALGVSKQMYPIGNKLGRTKLGGSMRRLQRTPHLLFHNSKLERMLRLVAGTFI